MHPLLTTTQQRIESLQACRAQARLAQTHEELRHCLKSARSVRGVQQPLDAVPTPTLRTITIAECELGIDEAIMEAVSEIRRATCDPMEWLAAADLAQYSYRRLPVAQAAEHLRGRAAVTYLQSVLYTLLGPPRSITVGAWWWTLDHMTVRLGTTAKAVVCWIESRSKHERQRVRHALPLDKITQETLQQLADDIGQQLAKLGEPMKQDSDNI